MPDERLVAVSEVLGADEVLEAGPAPSEGRICEGFGGVPCPAGFYCKLPNKKGADIAGTCVPGRAPPMGPSDLLNIAKERPE